MNIKYTLLLLILVVSGSCKNKKSDLDFNYLIPRNNIKYALDSFVNVCNDKNLIYEIYINKIYSGEYEIMLFAGKESSLQTGRPVSKVVISGIVFDIYSGIEHYFKMPNDTLPQNDLPRIEGPPIGYYWAIKEISDSLEIYPIDFSPSFESLPSRSHPKEEQILNDLQQTGKIKEYM